MSERSINILPMRAVRWLGFYGLVLLAWWAIYSMSRGDGYICGPNTVKLLPLGGFLALYSMWAVMMAAMMLPTIVPTLRTYDELPVRAGAGSDGWFGIVVGYGLIWLVGAGVFAGLQVLALNNGIVDLTGVVTSAWLAAALFLLAGFWQFSRTKEICQDACLSPMQFFMTRWKPGFSGGVRMGGEVGIACVGCCWAIMALAFVGGVMSLLWMGLATAFMVLEKLPEIGQHTRRPAGVALVVMGGFVAFRAIGII